MANGFYSDRNPSNLSNLEKNCQQIFVKGPAITKDFFDKIQHEMVPSKTDLFGYQMNTRKFFLLTGLLILFTTSLMGTVVMWFTDLYKKQINSMMVLSESSPGYDVWRAPPIQPLMKIYIFNYTNVEAFEKGEAEKLNVEELGPYAYFEQVEKVNIRFNKVDGTVSYQEKKTYTFSPDQSNGSVSDIVTVPNIPMLAGASVAKNKFNFLVRMSYSAILKVLSSKPFITLTADEFINGYEDNLYDFSKSYLKLQDKRVFDQFSLLATKAGIQPDVFTINTGAYDVNEFLQLEKFNGKTSVDMWSTKSCNKVAASDGICYKTSLLEKKKDLTFFLPQMCRKFSLKFDKEISVFDKVPAYKYKLPTDIFDNSEANECYCNREINGQCPPKGVFNATSCTFGAPIFFSFPHFYNADPEIRNAITGLKDNFQMDDTYVNINPKMGLVVGAKVQIQTNVQIQTSFGISELNRYPDGLLVPTVWIESSVEPKSFPSSVLDLIYLVNFTVRNVELGLKYGFLLTVFVTLTFFLLVIKKQREYKNQSNIRSRSFMNL